jgi:phytanoyl-CoA hydroxylase
MGQVLTESQIADYHRDGFLVLPGFTSPESCRAVKTRAEEMLRAFDPEAHRSVFTTNEQSRHADREFIESANGIHCFFEEEAFDDTGHLRQAKELSVNKIGHAMHDLDDVFAEFTYTPALAGVAADVGMCDALALQSMYICKQPRIGGEVGCHQDATFLYTDPVTVTGFWYAIEDATLENGCLWALPGGHRTSLRKRFVRNSTDDGATFEVLDPDPLPDVPGDLVPLEVEVGTMVVLHGLLPHWSDVNRSDKSRHAYSVHCISASAEYPSWNWLQRSSELPLRRLSDMAGAR